jgi:hypothetical protein
MLADQLATLMVVTMEQLMVEKKVELLVVKLVDK